MDMNTKATTASRVSAASSVTHRFFPRVKNNGTDVSTQSDVKKIKVKSFASKLGVGPTTQCLQ